jgi:hypothetical protein
MTLFRSFFDLKPVDRNLLLKTFFYSYYVRLIIWALSFSRVQKIAERMGKKDSSKSKINIKQIIWAVDAIDPYIVKSTCLTRAITAQILLGQQNFTSKLNIGVIKDNENFEAHAWLEVDDDVILGYSERKYIKILDI